MPDVAADVVLLSAEQVEGFRVAFVQAIADGEKLELQVKFRRKKHGMVPAGAQTVWRGETHSVVENEGIYLFFPEAQDNDHYESLTMFPHDQVEYISIIIEPPQSGMPATKKLRTEAKSATPTDTTALSSEDFAVAIRGEEKRKLVCPNLKVPAERPQSHMPFYPDIIVDKIKSGMSLEDAASQWKAAINEFVLEHQLNFFQEKLADFNRTKSEMVAWVLGLSADNLPATKQHYFLPFSLATTLLALMTCAKKGFAAEQKVKVTLRTAFDTGYWSLVNVLPLTSKPPFFRQRPGQQTGRQSQPVLNRPQQQQQPRQGPPGYQRTQ